MSRLRVNLRLLEPIWHVSGSVDLAAGQSTDQAFDRLDPLFRQTGTTRERSGDTLTFQKVDPAAQDKMAVFDAGVLRIEESADGRVLRYRMTSRILLFCFLAPFLFLAFAGATIGLAYLQKPNPTAAAEKKKAAEKLAHLPMNPIDKFLGAPAPEAKKDKDKDKKSKKKADEDDKPSPTPAYVFAGIFAILYLVGRVLEDRLIKTLFRKSLAG